jgi:hypothetical protein
MTVVDYTIKTRRTAAKVANLLDAVEERLLDFGRPRKRPYRKRDEAQNWDGEAMKLAPSTVEIVVYTNLPGAFRLAKYQGGFTKRHLEMAANEFMLAYSEAGWVTHGFDLADVDNRQADTRELVRAVSRARRNLANEWGV